MIFQPACGKRSIGEEMGCQEKVNLETGPEP